MTTQPHARAEQPGDPSAQDEDTRPVEAVKPTPFARVAARLAEVSPAQAGSGQASPGQAGSGQASQPEDGAEAGSPASAAVPEGKPLQSGPGDIEAAEPDPGQRAEPGEPGHEVPPKPRPPMAVVPQVGAQGPVAKPADGKGPLPPLPSRKPASGPVEWSEIKALFVDDPPTSVRLAAKQVELAVDRLTAGMKRAQDLAAASSGQGLAQLTEHLRVTLLAYQEICAEISRLTARLPGPQAKSDANTSLATTP